MDFEQLKTFLHVCRLKSFSRAAEKLGPLAERGMITRFLNSTEDTDKLGGLVEDIRDAIMDYQVRPPCACSYPA